MKIVTSGVLLRNKGKSYRRKQLIETNNILKYKCSQIPDVMYSVWVKQNSKFNFEFY